MRFDGLSVADWMIDSPRLDRLARDVVARIPETYADRFPIFSVFEAPSREGAHVDADAIYLDAHKFSNWADDIALGVLAHEFAHCCLHHGELESASLEQEREADELASGWGFQEEVRAMRAELGEPTEDPRSAGGDG